MPVGRKTGGRKKGTPNKATARREKEIAKGGDTPLDYMLKVMRNPKAHPQRRDDMAKAAAPYVHPKLAAVQHSGPHGGPIPVDLTHVSSDDLQRLKTIFGDLASVAGDDAEADQGGGG